MARRTKANTRRSWKCWKAHLRWHQTEASPLFTHTCPMPDMRHIIRGWHATFKTTMHVDAAAHFCKTYAQHILTPLACWLSAARFPDIKNWTIFWRVFEKHMKCWRSNHFRGRSVFG